jgi:glycosyltransferase involved in cell wall biosynthesis
MSKTVLFFGIFDPNYSRNRVLRNGFEKNGWQVEECRIDPKVSRGLWKYIVLARAGLHARKQKHDLVLVCFPGHSVVWLARLLFGERIIFDAFLSLYDSNVFDRKVYSEDSWRAKRDMFLDTWSCRLARKVLLDTFEHIEYFVATFDLPREKFERVWISADDTVFFPTHVPEEAMFTVHFHGTFIPLQGISYIVEAAKMLRDEGIRFRIVGSGQESEVIRKKILESNLESVIECTGKVPVERIPGYMAGAQVVLGIFGDTQKTRRVIPNKVFEALAMGKAIITADTPAMREVPGIAEVLILIPAADAAALAEAIKGLMDDEDRRKSLGVSARVLFEKEFLPERIVRRLIESLQIRA